MWARRTYSEEATTRLSEDASKVEDARKAYSKRKVLIGCPVGNGGRECMRGCGGFFKQFNRERMLQLLKTNKLDPKKMPCGTLRKQAKRMRRGKK